MNDAIKSELTIEEAFFNTLKAKLLKENKNKFVLIKERSLIGVYDSAEKAYSEGLNKFGNKPMFIRQIMDEEPAPSPSIGILLS